MIDIVALSKIYSENDNEVRALDDISTHIDDNDFIAIIGKSGSGKTTLLNLLGGIDRATSGSVIFDGVDIIKLKENELSKFRNENIGFVFQSYNLIPELTAEQNIKFPAMLSGKKLDDDYFSSLIDALELSDRLSHLPSEMSGGQQQRVAIARAFINKPKVILCDEPTGNLDSEMSLAVMNLLKKLHEEFSMTIILVTHDNDCASFADRIIKLKDGKIVS